MTYLVQKTNMFKQKMKIDDNIICNKMLTVQLWCIGSGALSSQKPWWITPDCQAITFTEGHEPVSHFASQAVSIIGRIETRVAMWDRKDEFCGGLRLERWHVMQGAEAVLARSGHPDTTTQKCSRAENVLLGKSCRVVSVCVCLRESTCKMPVVGTDPVLLPTIHMAQIETSGKSTGTIAIYNVTLTARWCSQSHCNIISPLICRSNHLKTLTRQLQFTVTQYSE